MRFKLTENRIDDLKRMIQKDMDKCTFEKEIPSYVDHINLLSIEEAEKIQDDVRSGLLKENILIWPKNNPACWWLCSPDSGSCQVWTVHDDGFISYFARLIVYPCNIRPILHLNPGGLITYETYSVYGEPWIAISEDCLLYNGNKCIEHIFDKETNVYENSEIRRYVENEWLNEIKHM